LLGQPLIVVNLDAVAEATRRLADDLLRRGIALIGVTKCVDGEPLIGRTMLEAGCSGLADSRLSGLVKLAAHALAPLTLIRPPQPDELEAVAQVADRVCLSDVGVARVLAEHARGAALQVLLTVDLGDRREGVLPEAAPAVATQLSRLPGIELAGICVNFACLSGQLPSPELFRQAEDVLAAIADACAGEPLLSLGGTCVVQALDGYRPRFTTELRAGGGPVFGYDFVSGSGIAGLERTDPVLSAVVLESYRKPPATPGRYGRDAFGHVPDADLPRDDAWYSLLNLGRRDVEPQGLRPLLPGTRIVGATSDVTVLVSDEPLTPGDEVEFAVDYDALVRAITSPYVACAYVSRQSQDRPPSTRNVT